MAAPNTPAYAAWRNNTNATWYKDKGLRRMAIHILMMYLCIFTFGYDGSLLNGLQTVPRWQKDFDRPTGNALGIIAASFYFPKIVTPVFASYIGDIYGRRASLLIASVISVAGAFVNTFANGRGMLIAGRAVLGAGLGMQATIAPTMIQELCHPRLRAVAGGMYLAFFYVGSTTAAWLCFGMINWNSSWAWRLPTIVQVFGTGAIGIYIALGLMVESPRWLFSKGKEEQALRTIADMHANGDIEDELVQHEMAEIKNGLQFDRENKGNNGYLAFFKTPGNRKRLFVLIVIAASSQLNGVGLVSYYIAPILKLIGITKPSQVAGINGGLAIWNLFNTLIIAQFVERIGRRPLWLTGAVGILCAFSAVTGLSGAFAQHRSSSVGTAVIPFLFIFYLFQNMAWAVLANLYVAEILPYSLRSKGMSIYVTTQSVSLAFNQYVNPVAIAAIAWKYYFVYIGIQVLLVIFAYFFLVETKGYTIEEVSRLFDGRNHAEEVKDVSAQGIEILEADDKGHDEHIEGNVLKK
ncbi:hypothetical protein I302_104654 [Kwoniella bestiolae CBS 10118]|uniref:Major facilitator superfamily (MFS) profile domain-containing protein n=1 Tax=Kwoniella bestiolae CBS 10118 TaxID=1296100 RepID=A0A1B9GBX3_9TREE|nr:hypothetical protein I302_03364 [Kwoniella bestiolae CBS 10118]OCF28505.1 hypothetical protein I302_03364 [Kwoniella bestiolae CBS 10118]